MRMGRGRGGDPAVAAIILEQAITPVYQPMVSLRDGYHVAFEGLSRVDASFGISSPVELFKRAKAAGRQVDMELLAHRIQLRRVAHHLHHRFLFLNVSLTTMMDGRFLEFVDGELPQLGVGVDQVVFEMTEEDGTSDSVGLRKVRDGLRERGYRVALDDFGVGFNNYDALFLLEPDFLKVDVSLIRGVAADPTRQAFLASLVLFAERHGLHLIAEGVEGLEDLRAVRRLGVDWVQGYAVARPSPEPREIQLEVRDLFGDGELAPHLLAEGRAVPGLLRRLLQTLRGGLEDPGVGESLVEVAARLVGAHNANLWLAQGPAYRLVCTFERDPLLGMTVTEAAAKALFGRLADGQVRVEQDLGRVDPVTEALSRSGRMGSVAELPLLVDGRLAGVLMVVFRESGQVTGEMVERLSLIGEMVRLSEEALRREAREVGPLRGDRDPVQDDPPTEDAEPSAAT